MSFVVDAKTYIDLCNKINSLINAELTKPKDIETEYPKLIIMYEFFRLLRGEAFADYREPTPDFQKELYSMEDKIYKRILELKDRIPTNNDKAKFHFDNLVSQSLKL